MEASDAERLEKIDELYRLRLDRHVELPQLIVAGDQSSGKSSVLEALTEGLPFPRDSGLCTRFPTQIVFKRSPMTRVEVSIIPADGKARISSFTKRELASLDHDRFLAIIAEACLCMGVPQPGHQSSDSKSFSLDLLKFELFSPSYEHFSVIDLPGLFRKTTVGHTTAEDIVLVRRMISTYIHNPRSIILAVVPANVDIATQEIIHMAEEADPTRKRTMGVLTKPDLVDAGAEDKILHLLKHDSSNLGFAVVCNRSQKFLASDTDTRNARERAFFESDPWKQVPPNRAGISAVKRLLNDLLRQITRDNFGSVVHDVEAKLQEHLQEMEAIGSARIDTASQRSYILQLTSEFQSLMSAAVQSSYVSNQCFDDPDLRLPGLIIKANEEFAQVMAKEGFTRRPTSSKGLLAKGRTDSYSENKDDRGHTSTIDQADISAHLEETLEFPELECLKLFSQPKPRYHPGTILTWIREEYEKYRGFGIGGMNPSLYQHLFKQHAMPWIALSHEHVDRIIFYIHRFLYKLLSTICKDVETRDRIWIRIATTLVQSYQAAIEQLNLLLEVEREGNLGTLNHYLAETIRSMNEARILHHLQSCSTWKTQDAQAQPLLRHSDVAKAWQSNEDHEIETIHDTLESYCKVARKRFVDNVSMQVIDHLLITSKRSPLKVLASAWAGALSDTDLADIAGEKESVRRRRKLLAEEIENLKKGLEILRR